MPLRYLNSADHYISENLRNQLIKTLNFPNNYFAVAIICLNPTEALFNSFSPQEYIQIKDGFYNVIKSLFMEKFVCYVIPTDEDVLDIVLNLEDKSYDALQDNVIIDESKRISIIFNHNDEKELQLALISLDMDRIQNVINGIFEKKCTSLAEKHKTFV
ncbi:MAG: hypothetical protein PUF72_07315 [Clostridiales bacterium]|nr:hypothetical protein [Clostridiales bacterium]